MQGLTVIDFGEYHSGVDPVVMAFMKCVCSMDLKALNKEDLTTVET